jgi:hypothetical protein
MHNKLSCIEIAFESHAYQNFKSKEVKLIYIKQTKLVVLMTNWEDIPMIVMAHSKTFESSTSPAENPSTGFRINSAKKQRQLVAFIIHFLMMLGSPKNFVATRIQPVRSRDHLHSGFQRPPANSRLKKTFLHEAHHYQPIKNLKKGS